MQFALSNYIFFFFLKQLYVFSLY